MRGGPLKARYLWRAYRARLQSQASELALIRRCVRPDDLVCDIGANKGAYLYWMARWARRSVAFEPQPGLARYLRTVADTLPLTNVTVEEMAVADRSGLLNLYVPSPNSPEASLELIQGAATLRVPVVALDQYFSEDERLAFLKIDVEGAELAVFRGAERILRDHRPALLFECEQRHLNHGTVFDCFSFLEARGYRGGFIDGRRLRPISQFDLVRHQSQEGARFWRAPGYCNNFLFEPA